MFKIVNNISSIEKKEKIRKSKNEKLRRLRGQAKCEFIIDFDEGEFSD